MVLQCPQCRQRQAYGRSELLGQLAVCPACEAVFGWKDEGIGPPDAPEANPTTSGRRSGMGRRRGSGAGGKRRDD